MNTSELIANATVEELKEIASAFSDRLWSPQMVMNHFDKKSSWFYGLAKSEVPAQIELWRELEACKIEIPFAGGNTSYYLAEQVKELEYSVQRAGALKWSPSSQPVRDTFAELRRYHLAGDNDPAWPAKVTSDNYRPDTMTDDGQLKALQIAFNLTDEDDVIAHHDACARFIDIAIRSRSRQTVTETEYEFADSVARAMKDHEIASRKTLV